MEGRIESTAARALPSARDDTGEAKCCGMAQTMVIPHVCTWLFLVLLGVRLEYVKTLSWRIVFFPFWIGDGLTIIKRLADLHKGWRPVAHLFDACGILVAKALTLAKLEGGASNLSAFEVISPYIVGVLCSAIVRGYIDSSKSRQVGRAPKCRFLSAFSAHVAFRGLQPVLLAAKLDGVWNPTSWGIVFIPSWILLGTMAAVAATLCNCTSLLSAGMQTRVRRQATRLVALCATQLLTVAGCLFIFGFLLAKRLDARDNLNDRIDRREEQCSRDENVPEACESPRYLDRNLDSLEPTTTAILAPLIAMYLALFILHPFVVRDSRKFQDLVQVVVSEGDEASEEARAVLAAQRASDIFHQMPVGTEDNNIIVEALSVPTRLLQLSSTLFQRTTEDLADDCSLDSVDTMENSVNEEEKDADQKEGDDLEMQRRANTCYVCFTEDHDAVLLECGHGGVCFACARSLATRHPRTCPICRMPITAFLKVKKTEGNIVVAEEGFTVRRM